MKGFKEKINIPFIWPMDYASGTVVGDSTTSCPMISLEPFSLIYQYHQVRNPIGGVISPITNMSSLILMESPYPLIPRAQPAGGVVMNLNQDELDNEGYGLA